MEGYPVNILNNTSNVAIDNPLPIGISINSSNISPYNTVPVGIIINTSNIAPSNPVPSGLVVNNANVSLLNTVPTSIIVNTSNAADRNPFPVYLPPPFTDAFGRIRVSQPFTLFDSFNRFSDDGKFVTYGSNTFSSNFNINEASIVLTVGSNAGDRIYRETTRVFAYQPGKSLQVFQTFCMNPPKIGLRQRKGYFGASNGIYLQQENSNISVVRRSTVTGTLQETIALQDSWNYDTMRGTGPSGFTLDLTRTQIFFMDIEWLGVGSVRTGFIIDGKVCICHIFHHANRPSTAVTDTTLPYMTTACLPVRSEIENIAATGSSSSFRSLCTTVISEGGYELRGRAYSISTGSPSVPISMPLANTLYNIIAIRLKSTRLDAIVIPVDISVLPISAGNFRWALIRNCTIDTPTWTPVNNDSSIEYALDGGIVTGGITMRSGYIPSTNQVSVAVTLHGNVFKFQLERNSFTSTPYILSLAVESDGQNDTVLASIDWEEVTI